MRRDPIDFLHMPARRFEAHDLIGLVGNIDGAIDGDVVVVPKDHEMRQLLHASKADHLLADPFHQAAIARHDVCIVVDDVFAPARALDFFGNGKPNGIGDALTQRPGCCFDPAGVAVFGMARCFGAPLAEILDLFECDILVACEVHQRRHARVAGVCSGDRIKCQRPDGSGFFPMVGVRTAQGCNIHVLVILLAVFFVCYGRHNRAGSKFKQV